MPMVRCLSAATQQRKVGVRMADPGIDQTDSQASVPSFQQASGFLGSSSFRLLGTSGGLAKL